jgi:4-hydroxy-4-methyl-2-oxoglutarate aldolase
MSLGYRVLERRVEPDMALVERLVACDTADLSDVMNYSHTAVGIRPAWPFAGRIAGPAVTVSLPLGGIDVIKLALETCAAGDVLVLAVRGATNFAVFGGYLSLAMRRRGLAGVVVDGAVRDVDAIAEARLPVLARATATMACPASPAAEVNVPVACAGAVIEPGDVVVADSNGVVAVPPARAEEVLAAMDRLYAVHESWDADLRAGRVPGVAGLAEKAREAGCELPARDG